MIRKVPAAVVRPMHCAVLPQLGANHPRGYYDTGMDLIGWDGHVYVSTVAVEELAKLEGWMPPSERTDLERRIEELEAENERLNDEVAQADEFAQAAEYTLARFGQKVVKKPGRKPQEKAVA